MNVIALHHTVEREQDLDACHLPEVLHFLPAAIVDVIVRHQAPCNSGSLYAARAAIVDMIAPYQMVADMYSGYKAYSR